MQERHATHSMERLARAAGQAQEARRQLQAALTARARAVQAAWQAVDRAMGPSPGFLWQGVRRQLIEAAATLDRLAQDLAGLPLIFVVGMGKYGKSTLVNALVGAPVAEVDILPRTWKIDVFDSRLPAGEAQVRLRSGEVQRMTLAQARQLVAAEEERMAAAEHQADEELQRRLPQCRDQAEVLELKQYLRQKYLRPSEVVEVHWPCPPGPLTRYFRLVDTPGLLQLHGNQVVADARDYYHKADGVLWLLDAHTLHHAGPHEVLADLDRWFQLVGGRPQNIVAVLNRIDLVRAQGGQAAVARVVATARKHFAGRFLEVVPCSAWEAFHGLAGRDHARLAASGFPELVAAVERHFLARGSVVQAQSKEVACRQVVQVAAAALWDLAGRARADAQRRLEVCRQSQATLGRVRQGLLRQLDHLLDSHGQKVEAAAGRVAALLGSGRERWVEPRRLAAEFLCTQDLEAALRELARHVERTLYQVGQQLMEVSTFQEFPRLPLEVRPQLPPLPRVRYGAGQVDLHHGLRPWEWAFLAAVGAGYLLGPVGIAAGFLVYHLLGEQKRTQAAEDGKFSVQQQWREMKAQVRSQVADSIAAATRAVRRAVNQVRRGSFRSLYGPARAMGLVERAARELEALAGPGAGGPGPQAHR